MAENYELTALMFVRALLLGKKNNYVTNGKGPQHAPVSIWEDEYSLDYDVIPYEKKEKDPPFRGTV